jgi:hypothetical protein
VIAKISHSYRRGIELRKRRFVILLGLIGSLVMATLVVNPVSATEIYWEDDFDDNNYDGWTKHGNEVMPALELDFDCIDGAVYVNKTNGAWGWLAHPSTESVGHWSFDFYQPTDGDGPVDFFFMCNWTTWEDIEGYSLHIQCFTDNEPIIYLWGWDGSFNGGNSFLVSYNHDSQIEDTWTHFDVTRNSTGIFVYLNSNRTPIIQYSDVTYNSSEVFMFSAGQYINGEWAEFGMDNVVVDDDENYIPPKPEPTTPTPSPTPSDTSPTNGNGEPLDPTMIMMIAGGGVAVIVVIAIVVKMRS